MLAVTDELPEGCTTVGEGIHLRFIVDKEKFISKLR
jgi:predicted thioesterase